MHSILKSLFAAAIRFAPQLIFILLSLILLASTASAVPRYDRDAPQTFDDLFKQALQNNPTYRSAWEEQVLARYTLYRAYGNFLPSVDMDSRYSETTSQTRGGGTSYTIGGVTYTTGRSTSGSSSYGVSLALPIWEGGANYGTLKSARLAVKAVPLVLSQSEMQLAYDLHKALNDAYAATELVKTARSAVELRRELLRLAEARLNVGATTEIDVLATRLDLGTSETTLLQAIQDSALTLQRLNGVVGVALDSRYPLVLLTEDTVGVPPLDTLLRLARAQSQPYRIAGINLQKSEYSRIVARAAWFPTLSLGQNFDWSETGGGAEKWRSNPNRYTTSWALSLNYPIFNGFQREQGVETAKVRLRQARWDYAKAELDMDNAVREAYASLTLLREQSRIAAANLELARRQRQLEQERYRIGAVALLQVQKAQDDELASEIRLISSHLNARTAKALLELAVGGALPRQ